MSKPMGVSEWKKHGKKYGYWEYFASNNKIWESLVDELKVTEPPKDVEKLKEKRQAFMAGQMNIILKLKMLSSDLLQEGE